MVWEGVLGVFGDSLIFFFTLAGCMEDPMFATCCESLVACRACTTVWLQESSHCVKCRAVNFAAKIHRVTGLSEIINPFRHLEF